MGKDRATGGRTTEGPGAPTSVQTTLVGPPVVLCRLRVRADLRTGVWHLDTLVEDAHTHDALAMSVEPAYRAGSLEDVARRAAALLERDLRAVVGPFDF